MSKEDTKNEITEQEAEEFRKQANMKIFGKNIPKPYLSFSKTGFPDYINKVLDKQGYKAPTPIQAQAWPICRQGRDIISLAETGSGKTFGFLVPGVIHLKEKEPLKRGEGPILLVLAPTRELAMQINVEAQKFSEICKTRSVCVYGGAPKNEQVSKLRAGAEIVIATPGRLIDLLKTGILKLDKVSYLVLDEADRMLDMGFEPQIRQIIEQITNQRQTLMWSATWGKEIQHLAQDFLNDPVIVNIGSVELTANEKVLQKFLFIQSYDKETRLLNVLDELMDGRKVIIFTQTKMDSNRVTSTLRNNGWPALCINGDKLQSERDWVMKDFRSGKCLILVATDVAARGLDIDDIKLVINYDMPIDVESYVHRIGRTARAGNTGVALSFFTPQDVQHAPKIKELLIDAKQEVPKQLEDIINRSGNRSGRGGRGGRGGGRGRGGRGGGNQFSGKRKWEGDYESDKYSKNF